MKTILLIITLMYSILHAEVLTDKYNECQNNLYFTNGLDHFSDNYDDAEIDYSSEFIPIFKKLLEVKNNVFNDVSLKRNDLSYRVSPVFTQSTENILYDKSIDRLRAIQQAVVDASAFPYYFSILGYLQNNKGESSIAKPTVFIGTQEKWLTLRENLLSFIDNGFQEELNNISTMDVYSNPLLQLHVENYKNDINKYGNSLLILGHSQGAYYGNFAYDILASENLLLNYFTLSAIGTFSSRVAGAINNQREGKDAYIIDLTDDKVSLLGSLSYNSSNTNIDSNESGHWFSSYLKGNDSAPKIYTMLKNQIITNQKQLSQWNIIEEDDSLTKKGSSEYRIKLISHIDNTRTVDNVMPFGFDTTDKIQYLTYKNGVKKGQKALLKGSCQATSIIDHTEDLEGEELIIDGKRVLYELEDTNQYIFGDMVCKDPSLFEIITQSNENTAEWRISVKNTETNETIGDVYPFNLDGSLYQLSTGEWVKASCGGKNIVSQWNDKKDNEFYLLEGTNEKIEKNLLTLKYDNVQFIYDKRWENINDWNNYNIDRVRMFLIGKNNGKDDVPIAFQQSDITPTPNGPWGHKQYTGSHRTSDLYIGSNIFYETSDIDELTNLIGKDIPLKSAKFHFTQSMFNKLVK